MRNKVNKLWVAISTLLFLSLTCSSQTRKVHSSSCTSIYPLSEMTYVLSKGDTAFVTMYADSMADGYKLTLAARFPQEVDFESLIIKVGLQYGGFREFFPDRYDYCTGSVECDLNADDIQFLKSSPFDFISFDDRYTLRPSMYIKSKRYFIRFLSDYNR